MRDLFQPERADKSRGQQQLQAALLMQVAVELSVPSVGLSPSLQTLQVAVDASAQQVTCRLVFLTHLHPVQFQW